RALRPEALDLGQALGRFVEDLERVRAERGHDPPRVARPDPTDEPRSEVTLDPRERARRELRDGLGPKLLAPLRIKRRLPADAHPRPHGERLEAAHDRDGVAPPFDRDLHDAEARLDALERHAFDLALEDGGSVRPAVHVGLLDLYASLVRIA